MTKVKTHRIEGMTAEALEYLLDTPIIRSDTLIGAKYAIGAESGVYVSPAVWDLLDGAEYDDLLHLAKHLPLRLVNSNPKSLDVEEINKWLKKVKSKPPRKSRTQKK